MATRKDGIIDVRFWSLGVADRLDNPLLRRLHADWCAAAVDGGVPDHDFIDPLKLDYLLGQLMVVGVACSDGGGLRFRYRLVGTDLVARRHRDVTGEWMDEHWDPGVAVDGPQACRLAVETRRPVRVSAGRRLDGQLYPVEYLLLPLSDGGVGTIDRLLIAQIYAAATPRLPYGSGQE